MRLPITAVLLGLLACAPAVRAEQVNAWPFWIGEYADNHTPTPAVSAPAPLAPRPSPQSWHAVGPLLYARPSPLAPTANSETTTTRVAGLRPLYIEYRNAASQRTDAYVLYPLFHWHISPFQTRWTLLNLINWSTDHPNPRPPLAANPTPRSSETGGFDLWPFYFSRRAAHPAQSYRALFPIYGEIKNRLGNGSWRWVFFPLYGRFEKNGVVTTTAPWPIVKVMRGDGNSGWELWPLYGQHAKPGAYREWFALWPLIYKKESALWQAVPDREFAFLPFYSSEHHADFTRVNFAWPFLGTTHRTAPFRYDETRYFWPFLVQGRGDERLINRWAPFYTHSVIKGVDKTWILWPLWRQQTVDKGRVTETRRQLLYFLYHDTQQVVTANPSAAPARKTHLWPLFSRRDDGHGHLQFQALSPFEVFFPHNDPVREAYSPLLALYRYDRPAPGTSSHSVLWNLVSSRRTPTMRAFHLGPLYGSYRDATTRRHALLGGLLGLEKNAAGHWRPFAFKFRVKPAPATPAASPSAKQP